MLGPESAVTVLPSSPSPSTTSSSSFAPTTVNDSTCTNLAPSVQQQPQALPSKSPSSSPRTSTALQLQQLEEERNRKLNLDPNANANTHVLINIADAVCTLVTDVEEKCVARGGLRVVRVTLPHRDPEAAPIYDVVFLTVGEAISHPLLPKSTAWKKVKQAAHICMFPCFHHRAQATDVQISAFEDCLAHYIQFENRRRLRKSFALVDSAGEVLALVDSDALKIMPHIPQPKHQNPQDGNINITHDTSNSEPSGQGDTEPNELNVNAGKDPVWIQIDVDDVEGGDDGTPALEVEIVTDDPITVSNPVDVGLCKVLGVAVAAEPTEEETVVVDVQKDPSSPPSASASTRPNGILFPKRASSLRYEDDQECGLCENGDQNNHEKVTGSNDGFGESQKNVWEVSLWTTLK
ncbi:hypothetical protein HK102_004723, partial [Quaeritorhiza haematococci]